ncbi:hypothetical protein ACIPSA_46365 [Streptomyces sp. NPDC086549]|uniref:hypothetical protein n=1 Tax=Streptomyces sp. NPDC086549 TaxID=3365752 RepID=UPI00381C6A84
MPVCRVAELLDLLGYVLHLLDGERRVGKAEILAERLHRFEPTALALAHVDRVHDRVPLVLQRLRPVQTRLDLGGVLVGDGAHGQGQPAELDQLVGARGVGVRDQCRLEGDGPEKAEKAAGFSSRCVRLPSPATTSSTSVRSAARSLLSTMGRWSQKPRGSDIGTRTQAMSHIASVRELRRTTFTRVL